MPLKFCCARPPLCPFALRACPSPGGPGLWVGPGDHGGPAGCGSGPERCGTCWRLQWWWNATLILPGALAAGATATSGAACPASNDGPGAGAVPARHGTAIVLPIAARAGQMQKDPSSLGRSTCRMGHQQGGAGPLPSRHRAERRATASRGGLTAAARAGEQAICFPPKCERAGGRVGGQMQAGYSQRAGGPTALSRPTRG